MNAFVISIGATIVFVTAAAFLGWRIILALRLRQLERRENKRRLAELQHQRQLADERRRDPRQIKRRERDKQIKDFEEVFNELTRRHMK